MQVVKDGEGLTKFVTFDVGGAESDAAPAHRLSIANSPLLKTAIAGEDPNWGRVVMAIGKSGEAADRDRLSIWFGPHLVASNGERAPAYDEDRGRLHEGRRDRHSGGRRGGPGLGDRVDLRPDPRLHLDQRRLSQLALSAWPFALR